MTVAMPRADHSSEMRSAGRFPLPSVGRTLSFGGRDRSYRLHRPAPGGGHGPVPLVVVLHGGYGSGGQAEQAYGWDALADRHCFLVAYPDGVGRSWNAGWCCGPPTSTTWTTSASWRR